tara:strand:- start:629 stop:1540 length:912 start_codon:yes stop_codon:yes gene_type:complete
MKFGTFSTILNYNEYSNLMFDHVEKQNVVLKLTYENIKHNGEIELIHFLNKESKYVCKIYKDSITKINLNPFIYTYLKKSLDKYDDDRICKLLRYSRFNSYFIENLGEFDVFDKIDDIIVYNKNIWDSNQKIILFMQHMCQTLDYLKSNSICHFDIKPENIMYNEVIPDFGMRFKLIDFGFAEKYPFDNYINKIIGTKYYVPKYYSNLEYPEWHTKIECNDWIYDNNKLKHCVIINKLDYELIYKTDIFSLGMVFIHLLYYLKPVYKELDYSIYETLTVNMTHYDIVKRYSYIDCLNYLNNFE